MNQKLTPSPVARSVVAVEPLSQDGRELDWEEVKDIWPELPLPYRLVDRVRVLLERRETLPVPRKGQKPSLAISFADLLRGMATFAQVGLMGAMVASIIWVNDRKEAIANRIAHPPPSKTRILLSNDYGKYFVVFNLQERPHLYYRVTWQNPPKDKKLSLSCDWIDPTGQVVHQNLYQTKLISHNVWTSACSYQLGDKAKPGTWQVKMSLGDRASVAEQYRLLTKTEFIVE